MTEQNISSYFKKSTRTSTRFLRQIWRFDKADIQTRKVYRGYVKKCRFSYINDFIRHRSMESTNLSPEEILSIHENNADMTECHDNASTGKGRQRRHRVESNFERNSSISSRYTSNNSDEHGQWTTHLTDAFLDKFHIPPGQKKKRCQTYKMKSELIFHCLSYQLGTWNIVKLRQNLRRKYTEDLISVQHPNFNIHYIGSKSEGLDMDGSDQDILISERIYAHETTLDCVRCKYMYDPHFKYNSLEKHVYPGYVLLRTFNDFFVKSCDFNNIDLKQKFTHGSRFSKFAQHGPAIMHIVFGQSHDTIISIESPKWPQIADGWKTRPRYFGWPSEEMITNITRKGCHIVPVGSNRNHTKDSEWRLSFCIAERELVWTFNQTQIMIYGLLKLVLKEIINQNSLITDLICSYFLKTVMFWVIEETSSTIWSPNNMIFLFHITLHRLVQFVVDNECPNYFIPSNNMFKDRINDVDRANLLHMLLDIEDSGMAWMYQSRSLRRFADSVCVTKEGSRYENNFIRLKSVKKGKVDSYRLIQNIVIAYRLKISEMYQQDKKMMKYIFKSIKTFTIKRKVLPFLVHFIKANDHFTGNKTLASLQKFCMDLFVQEAFGSFHFGKHILALHFYYEGKFSDCWHVLNGMSRDMDLCTTHNSVKTAKYECLFGTCINSVSTLTHLKYFFTHDIMIPLGSYLLSNNELAIFRPMISASRIEHKTIVYPELLVKFLRCLCLVKLDRYESLEDAYVSLKNIEYVIHCKIRKVDYIWQLTFCHALKNGIKIDCSDQANFVRYQLSHWYEIGIPFDISSIEEWPGKFNEAGMVSNALECIDNEVSNSPFGQELRKILSEPHFREKQKHFIDEYLPQMPPTARKIFTNLFAKL